MTDKHDVMPCPDGDLCPDARRYGKIHPKPDDPKTTRMEQFLKWWGVFWLGVVAGEAVLFIARYYV